MPHADATKAQLIVALDLPTRKAALDMALKLRGTVRWCKVGMEVFTLAGPDFLEELHRLGYHVFLDLKFYDIPHTVAQAVKAAAAAGVRLLTVHCQGGERMCRAAVEAVHAAPNRPLIFGVTALTSFAAGSKCGQGRLPGASPPLSGHPPGRIPCDRPAARHDSRRCRHGGGELSCCGQARYGIRRSGRSRAGHT